MKLLFFLSFLFLLNSAFSQELSITQNFSFGTFAPSFGTSTVTIDPYGTRTISGGAIPIGYFNYFPAIFMYTTKKGKPKNIVAHIIYDPNINISSNGHSMTVKLGPTNKINDTFITSSNQITEIRIGGRLTINNITSNPSGNYLGTFTITVIQE